MHCIMCKQYTLKAPWLCQNTETDALPAHSCPTSVIKTSFKSIYLGLWKPLWVQTSMWHTSHYNYLLSVHLNSVIYTQGLVKHWQYRRYCVEADIMYRKINTELWASASPQDIQQLLKAKVSCPHSVPNYQFYFM